MARCYRGCIHFIEGVNYCDKYKMLIHNFGTLLHPFDFLSIYYDESDNDDLHGLIDLAERFLTDEASRNICTKYRRSGKISFPQRKLLIYNLLHCYEEK